MTVSFFHVPTVIPSLFNRSVGNTAKFLPLARFYRAPHYRVTL